MMKGGKGTTRCVIYKMFKDSSKRIFGEDFLINIKIVTIIVLAYLKSERRTGF